MEIPITNGSMQTIKAEMIEQKHQVQPHFYTLAAASAIQNQYRSTKVNFPTWLYAWIVGVEAYS